MERYNHLGRPLDRRPRDLDRPHDRLDRPAGHPGFCRGHFRPLSRPRASPARHARTGARATPGRRATGASAPPPSTASSPGRRLSIPSASSSSARKCCSRRASASSSTAGPLSPSSRTAASGASSSSPRRAARAIIADVVVDTTGDGDMFARAGGDFVTDIEEGDVHHSANTAFMLGGVDMDRWLAFRANEPEQYAKFAALGREKLGFFQPPYVSWRTDIGPVPRPAPDRAVGGQYRRPDRARDPLAPLHEDALRLLPRTCPRVRELLHAAERAAARRAPYAPACRHGPDRAQPVERGDRTAGRDRRQPLGKPQFR